MTAAVAAPIDLVVVVLAQRQWADFEPLVGQIRAVLSTLDARTEIIVVVAEGALRVVEGAAVVVQRRRGYGAALMEGLAAGSGAQFVVTINADLSHSPAVIARLWAARDRADIVVASRYVAGGTCEASLMRSVLSRVLNRVFARALSVPVRDLSSGFRLYRVGAVTGLQIENEDFAALPELLVRAYAQGYRVAEVPCRFVASEAHGSFMRLARFGWSYTATLWRLWQLRNSIHSADYDHRAFDSIIWLQRYWQRTRHRIVLAFAPNGGRILDVGCGSSRILQDLPGAVGVDVLLNKLRFLRPVHPQVVRASVFALPFADLHFDTVICSEVIEHIPDDPRVLGELTRVLKPGGTLVLGTPDYGRLLWHIIEWVYGRVAPGGYADEHITHFDRRGLQWRLTTLGYDVLQCSYVGASEMILKARKGPMDG